MNWYALLFGGFAAAILFAFVSFEVLVWRLYAYHPYDWQAAGSPPPLFTPLFTRWEGHLARRQLNGAWLFRTPDWILTDSASRVALYIHRLCTAVVLAGPLSFVIAALLLS